MAKTIGEALRLLNKLGDFELTDFRMDNNEPTYHHINHKFRETIVVPYIAIEHNIQFLTNKADRYVVYADGITAKVVESKEVHICELEDEIQKLYGISAWQFMQRWYQTYKNMSSMEFVIIKVTKEENNGR